MLLHYSQYSHMCDNLAGVLSKGYSSIHLPLRIVLVPCLLHGDFKL